MPQRHRSTKNFRALSSKEEELAAKIVGAAFRVHTTLGPGLFEKIYEVCFCHELFERELQFQRQVDLPIV